MSKRTIPFLATLALTLPFALTACDDGAEEFGEGVDEAIDDAGDALEDAGDEIEDAVND